MRGLCHIGKDHMYACDAPKTAMRYHKKPYVRDVTDCTIMGRNENWRLLLYLIADIVTKL